MSILNIQTLSKFAGKCPWGYINFVYSISSIGVGCHVKALYDASIHPVDASLLYKGVYELGSWGEMLLRQSAFPDAPEFVAGFNAAETKDWAFSEYVRSVYDGEYYEYLKTKTLDYIETVCTLTFMIASDVLTDLAPNKANKENNKLMRTRDLVYALVHERGWICTASHIGRNSNYIGSLSAQHPCQIWVLTPPCRTSLLIEGTAFSTTRGGKHSPTPQREVFTEANAKNGWLMRQLMEEGDYVFKGYWKQAWSCVKERKEKKRLQKEQELSKKMKV